MAATKGEKQEKPKLDTNAKLEQLKSDLGNINPLIYDLHSNQNPRSVIAQVHPQGENCEEWVRAMQTSMMARRKRGFVDGTRKQPKDCIRLHQTGNYAGHGKMVRANVAQTVGTCASAFVGTSFAPENSGQTCLTDEQRQALAEFLKKSKSNTSARVTIKNKLGTWIIDAGASNHMTGSLKKLSESRDIFSCLVGLSDGQSVTATKQGTVKLDGGLKLKTVLYAPSLNCNLILVSQLIDESNCIFQFTSDLCIIQDHTSKMVIGVGERRDGLYFFQEIPNVRAFKTSCVNQLELWHKRMGHPSLKTIKLLPSVNCGKISESINKACEVCQRAKQNREKFTLSDHKAVDVFELIHCDLWGPYRTPSSCGASYFLTIVDNCSRVVWISLLIDKKEVTRTLINFFAMVERQYNIRVKIVRSDNGTEFTCKKGYFLEQGIMFQTSCTGTPQQNGRVERKHRHILTIARALQFQGNLLIEFWGECILAAGYLINRTPTLVLYGKTPYEVLYGQAPSYEHLRVFGSLCYACSQGRKGDKFASISRKCLFVGYPYGKKGWKFYDLETKEFIVSRDIEFLETTFPFDQEVSEQSDNVMPNTNGIDVNDRSGSGEFIETVFEPEN